MIELVTRLAADQLKINKAENQRRDLISQASTVWREYNDTLSVCQGLQIPESGFNPEKMAAVFSEVITFPISDTTFGWKVSALFCDAFLDAHVFRHFRNQHFNIEHFLFSTFCFRH